MRELIERLLRKADSTVESPAPHLTGDMKFYVYDAETRELLTEAAAALEAAREDASRWRERYVAELSCYRMDLHGDEHNEAIERARATAEKIAAIDQARGKEQEMKA